MIYLQLFLSFLQIGLFSIGGGYAALPLIQNQIVELHGWLTMAQFADVISIAEMTPGPIAVNAATFVGIKIAGVPGTLVATLGCILPSCVIVMLLAHLYQRYHDMALMQGVLNGLRPAVVGLVASAGVSILLLALFHTETIALSNVNWLNAALLLGGIVVLRLLDLNPIWIIAASGAAGVVFYLQQPLAVPLQAAIDAAMAGTVIGLVALRRARSRKAALTAGAEQQGNPSDGSDAAYKG